MNKHLIPAIAIAVAGLFAVTGSGDALAQGAGGGAAGGGGTSAAPGGGGSQPSGPIGNPNQPAGKNTDKGVISRPMGAAKDEAPTDPNKASEPEVKKLEKETQKQ
jgi:hypothetical protein